MMYEFNMKAINNLTIYKQDFQHEVYPLCMMYTLNGTMYDVYSQDLYMTLTLSTGNIYDVNFIHRKYI